MVFEIKMDGDLTCKAHFVASEHTTNVPNSVTYSSMVSHESVHIAFLIVTLNDL